MKNKVVNIDGAPGITLEGVKGAKGRKGGMIFFADDIPGIDPFSIFDMWVSDSIESGPAYINERNYCEYASPDEYDYIVTHTQNMAYVYIVEAFIPKDALYDYDGSMSKFTENSKLTKEAVEYIYNYYTVHPTNDCCIVRKISALNTVLLGDSGNIHNFDITISLNDISYTGYSGSLHVDESGTGKAFQIEKTAKYLSFSITGESREEFENVKIEAEFYRQGINGEMHSVAPSFWSTTNSNLLNRNFPCGYLENYTYTLSYDDENLDNFTVVIKDYADMPASTVFESGIKIPETMVSDYSVSIYAYCTTISGIEKIYVGDLDLLSII